MKYGLFIICFLVICCCGGLDSRTLTSIPYADKIVIVNRTSNTGILNRCTIIDEEYIRGYTLIANESRPIVEVEKINIQRGFYEIQWLLGDSLLRSVSVIYTVYDGVIVEENHVHFKNDELEHLTTNYLTTSASRCQ